MKKIGEDFERFMRKVDKQNKIIELAAKMYEGLSEEDIDEMEKVMLDRSNFFGEKTKKLEEILEGNQRR